MKIKQDESILKNSNQDLHTNSTKPGKPHQIQILLHFLKTFYNIYHNIKLYSLKSSPTTYLNLYRYNYNNPIVLQQTQLIQTQNSSTPITFKNSNRIVHLFQCFSNGDPKFHNLHSILIATTEATSPEKYNSHRLYQFYQQLAHQHNHLVLKSYQLLMAGYYYNLQNHPKQFANITDNTFTGINDLFKISLMNVSLVYGQRLVITFVA
ncbi:hypothetical protein ACTFIU_007061 [Dictyostelium citrinum]